jgi:hypothetical protein
MAMKIEKQFTVRAPADRVWAFLTDPHRVAQCLPGAAITGQEDEHTYAGTVTVKVGPVQSSYRGKIRFEKLDVASRTAELSARGQDVRGKGGADMRMTSRLVERGDLTDVTVVSEVNVTGILAQFGRGMIQDVSDHMFQQFSEAMRAELESQPAAPVPPGGHAGPARAAAPPQAIDAVSLGTAVAGRAARRAAGHPGFWVAVILVALALYWLFGR